MIEPSVLPRHARCPAVLTVLACLLLTACAATPTGSTRDTLKGPELDVPAGPRWFALRFRQNWPESSKPRWEQDLLLADAVVRPTLEAHEQRLYRWRFHRRAARTPSGHQFSFIFLTDAATASRIHEEVESHPTVAGLLMAGQLDLLRLEDYGDDDLATTSDPSWPEHLQKHWPVFIMGASAVWLELIGECAGGNEPDGSLENKLAHYRACHASITEDWHEWGQHAFLHHLSGIFGYQRMLIRKEIRF